MKILSLNGGIDYVVSDYYLSGLDNRGKVKVKYTDKMIGRTLSIGCTYKLQVRAYKKVGSKYYLVTGQMLKPQKKLNGQHMPGQMYLMVVLK